MSKIGNGIEEDELESLELGIEIDEIVPGFLFLGDFFSSQNEKALKKRGIKVIINCTHEIKKKFDGFEYHQIELFDWCSQDLSEAIKECNKILEEAKEFKPKKPVYVHCHAGMSRSVSVVIAYIMKTMKYSYDEAYKYVHSKRDVISPNIGFIKQLKALEDEKSYLKEK